MTAWQTLFLSDAEELLRLKQVSGLASLFADKEFSPADPEMV